LVRIAAGRVLPYSRASSSISLVDAADRRHPRRRVVPARAPERVEAERVAGDVVVIEQLVADQHVHQAERQRAVGSRQQRDVLVALVGGRRAAGVDGDQAGTAPFRFLRQAPEVQVGDDAVASPDDDQPRIDDVLGVEADAAPIVAR
jgi:hypothetical protein